MTHDFEKALDYIGSKHYHPRDMMRAYQNEIQLALRIADRLQKGDVSDGMVRAALDRECFGIFYEGIFKAMSQQLLKEMEDV